MQVEIFNLDSAKLDVDAAIATAIKEQKPVYINICCNIACELRHLPHLFISGICKDDVLARS